MKLDLVRYWKDEDYRESLSAEEKALLAENPAGAIELTNTELGMVDGAVSPTIITTIGFTVGVTLSLAYCSQASACCPPETTAV